MAADDDEIDILGDFSFNSCFAQNNQGIPSCSSREDTVHPQWLLDSTEANWYDKQCKETLRKFSGPSRKLLGDHTLRKYKNHAHSVWSQAERNTLAQEMSKYGRDIKKISQRLKTKTETEIQALIDAEFGVYLETSSHSLEKFEDQANIPAVVQEEIVADDSSMNNKVVIIAPENIKHPFRKKNNMRSQNSLLKPNATQLIDCTEIFYEDDMVVGSTESIGTDLDMTDIISKNIAKQQAKAKAEKKIGNHRRKVSRNYDRGPRFLKSPQARQRKDSGLSDENMKSPKMQIVLGSGQALPVSEGEQVIKIEKKKDSEPESDIDIDVDSDDEGSQRTKPKPKETTEEPIAVPLRKFEPMPRRQKKIHLDGGGGYTIMHTEAGDLYEVGSEPRREKQAKKQPVHLIRCKVYNADKPAPYEVSLHVSTLILMDVHGHTSTREVMGLTGGTAAAGGGRVLVSAYRPAAALASSTHCDMDPVSQSQAAEQLASLGLAVCGWHHSHPRFPCAPSALDLQTQGSLQRALEWSLPLLGFITSQHWPAGRRASQYRCLRVEEDEPANPVGYQLSVQLVADLTQASLPAFLQELGSVVHAAAAAGASALHMPGRLCPQAGITYLEKCISSISHHMRSAGYADLDPLIPQLIQGLRDVLR